MGEYLHKFESLADFNTAYNGNDYVEPWVSYTTYNQAISFTSSIYRGGEFGPYDGTFYTETNSMTVQATTVTGTFYIWKNNDDEYIATATRVITEGMYYEHVSKFGEGGTMGATYIGDNEYTLINISSVVNETKGVVDYNKHLLDYDIELDTAEGDECGGQKIIYASNKINPIEEVYDGSYAYNVSNPNVTTNPVQSLKVKVINSDGYNGVYELPLTDSSEGGNAGSLELESDVLGLNVHVNLNNGTYVLNSVLTGGC